MRILYLADVRFPLERANGIQTFETCRALAARGHAVTLLVRPDTHAPPRDPFAFYGAAPQPTLTVATVTPLPQALRRAGYVTRALLQATLARRPDVVFTRDLSIAALLLRSPRRPPLVYESHGYAPQFAAELPGLVAGAPVASPAKLRRLAERERAVWAGADGYVTITAALGDDLVARFGPRANVSVVPDGVRLPVPRVFAPPPPGDPVVGYAGHLYPWKGADVLIDAMAHLPARVRALVVGGHPGEGDLARLESRASETGVADRVTFAGMRPPAEVAAALAACHVLVLPNTQTMISARYTSPLKLFEYLAAGRPIVASDLPALREVLRHGETALLVPPGDAAALAAAVSRIVDDAALADRMARAAFDAADAYDWSHRAARLEPVLAGARPRARAEAPA